MTIFVPCEQGSPEWMNARRGIPTASCFDKIVTPTGKLSRQADAYRMKLLGAWFSGLDDDEYTSPAMEHGKLHEPEAREWYAFTHDEEVRKVGFAYLNELRLVGCSPDGLIGDDGMAEFKCPQFAAHMETLISGKVPQDHKPQIQGNLWILDRQWCDFVSYHPGLPEVVIRVERDQEYIDLLSLEVGQFVHQMRMEREWLANKYQREPVTA